MGNYKNPNAIDVVVSGSNTVQGGIVVGATPAGKYSVSDPVSALSIDATVAGRIYGKYKNTGSTINYYQ